MHMSKKLKITAVTVLSVIVVAAAVLPAFIRATTTPAMNACVNNLRQIDGAKQQWMVENRKTTNDVVAWDDIRPYLKPTLVCPQGGTYILGRIGESPRCSIGGTHTLPPDTLP